MTVRIAFIGVGSMGQCAHLANYVGLPGCEVIALAELRPELARKVAARYAVPKVYASDADLLAQERPDALVAIQPFTKHGQLIPRLLATGLPVLTEKPLARSIETGERILQAAQESGNRLSIAYHKRSDPATLAAKRQMTEWQENGQVGRLRYIRLTMPPGDWVCGGFHGLLASDEPYPALPDDPRSPDMSREQADRYDAFVNYYIHQINLLRFLLGEDYRAVHAEPERLAIVFRSVSGVSAVLEAGIYATSRGWQESALIAFERGWIRLELPAPLAANQAGRVAIYQDPGNGAEPIRLEPILPPVHAMRQQALHFLQAARGEATALCTAEDALADLRVARQVIELPTD